MRRMSVLLIDDEPSFVDILSKRLSKRGFCVFTSYSGQEALEQLGEGQSIDVAILDIKMPGMDGMAALSEIRKRFPGVRVIILTSLATVKTAIEGMKLGAFDCLMKPCDIDQLTTRIREAVSEKDY